MDRFSSRRRGTALTTEAQWREWVLAVADDRAVRRIEEYHQARLNGPEPPVLRELRAALREAQDACLELERRVQLLTERHDQLDDRFTDVLALRAGDPGSGGAGARRVEHQQIAEQYRAFVDQDVQTAARESVKPRRRRRDAAAEQQAVASQMAHLTGALFGGPAIDIVRLEQLLDGATPRWLARLAVTGTELRERAAASAPRGHWDFDRTPGEAIDPARQTVWGRYVPEAAVAFVVAPAYLVGDRVYAPQRVTTTAHLT